MYSAGLLELGSCKFGSPWLAAQCHVLGQMEQAGLQRGASNSSEKAPTQEAELEEQPLVLSVFLVSCSKLWSGQASLPTCGFHSASVKWESAVPAPKGDCEGLEAVHVKCSVNVSSNSAIIALPFHPAPSHTHSHTHHGMWGLSSLTRHQTHGPCIGRAES